MKKAISILLAGFIMVPFVGCTRPSSHGEELAPGMVSADTVGGRKFGATYMTMNNPFFGAINDSIKEKVQSNGDILITLDPALEQDKQISQIEDMIAEGIEVLFLTPVDWKGVKPALNACQEAGVLVVNVDAPVYDQELVQCTVASDNYAAGGICAEDMMGRMSAGNIAIITHPTAKSGEDRIAGFDDVVFQNSAYREVARVDSLGQLENAMPLMEGILRSRDRIDAVMALNDPSAQGAISALKAAGYHPGDILVYGVDGSPDAKKLIEDGWMTATAAQSPRSLGATAVDMAYKLLAGEPVDRLVLVDITLITKDNVAQFSTDGWQ